MSHEWNCRCARCEAEKDWQAERDQPLWYDGRDGDIEGDDGEGYIAACDWILAEARHAA